MEIMHNLAIELTVVNTYSFLFFQIPSILYTPSVLFCFYIVEEGLGWFVYEVQEGRFSEDLVCQIEFGYTQQMAEHLLKVIAMNLYAIPLEDDLSRYLPIV